ncbi:hypothetical protein ACFY4H_25545 [Streptomyces althioticus]
MKWLRARLSKEPGARTFKCLVKLVSQQAAPIGQWCEAEKN